MEGLDAEEPDGPLARLFETPLWREWVRPVFGPHPRDTEQERFFAVVATWWGVGLLTPYGAVTGAILAVVMPVPAWVALFGIVAAARFVAVYMERGGQALRLLSAVASMVAFSLTSYACALSAPMPGLLLYGTYAWFESKILYREWVRRFG